MSALLIIFGAGASHDAPEEGFDQPPLATNLFDSDYDETLRQFRGVDILKGTIRSRVSREQNLEQVLGDLARNRNEHIQWKIREVPVYLKILIAQFTGGYRPGTYDSLINLVHERDITTTFVTLNYDTLLDNAILEGYRSPIDSIDSYIGGGADSEWSYVKLHGSVNWGYTTGIDAPRAYAGRIPMTRGNIAGYLEAMHENLTDTSSYDHRSLHLLSGNDDLSLDGELVYPALAIPADTKDEIVCPPEHVQVLRNALASDPAILVVGNQGLDADLMGILRESSVPRSGMPFHVVDPWDGLSVAARFADALGGRAYSDPPLAVGFSDFVEGGDAEQFLDQVVGRPHWPRT